MVISLNMAIGRSRNESINFLLAKTLISDVVVNALIRTPGLFEAVFYFLKKTCNIHWDVSKWRFRLQLDSYIVYAGMLCGIALVYLSDALRSDPYECKVFGRFRVHSSVRRVVREIRIVSVVFAVGNSIPLLLDRPRFTQQVRLEHFPPLYVMDANPCFCDTPECQPARKELLLLHLRLGGPALS